MRFEHNESDVNDSSRSQTTQCQTYSFQLADSTIYNFIDTPGISDVGGYLKDNANVDMIFDKVEQLPVLHAIILVLNGAVGRLTSNVKNVLQRFGERIPDTLYSNLIVLLTNCERYSCNFEPDNVGLPSSCTVIYMQNSAFSSDSRELTSKQKEVRNKEWEQSMATIDKLLMHLDQMMPINTDAFQAMHDVQNYIKTLLHESRLIFMELQQVDDLLSSLVSASKAYSSEKNKYQNFRQNQQITTNEWVETKYHNTLCMTCSRVCHEQCTLQETSGIGAARGCCAFRDDRCQECKCSSNVHYHGRKTLQQVKKTVSVVIGDLQTKFEKASVCQAKIQHEALSAEDTRLILQQALQAQLNEVENGCRQVKEQCTGYNPVTDLNTFVTLLDKDATSLKSSSVRDQAANFVAQLRKLCAELSYVEPQRTRSRDETARAIIAPIGDDSTFSDETDEESAATQSKGKRIQKERSKKKSRNISEDMEVDSDNHIEPVLTNTKGQSLLSNESADHDDSGKNIICSKIQQNTRSTTSSVVRPVLTQTSSLKSASVLDASDLSSDRTQEDTSRFFVPLVDYKKASTAELVGIHTDSANTQRITIEKELNRRCHGEFFGFLDQKQMDQFVSFVSENQHSEAELLKMSHLLTQDIQRIAGFHPLGIVNVPEEKLLQLAAVKSLLRKATKK